MKMSDLLQGKYFSFENSNVVYYVEQLIYAGDYSGNFHFFYSKLGSQKVYKWSTADFDKKVIIYDN